MAINNDRSLLEQQILSNSGLKGKELENLKARLATLSEQQLQAELSKSLAGNNKGEWYTGVMLEHNESVVMRNNHDQTTYTDDNGNEIIELKDGDDVVERTIKSTDDKGNILETTVTFSGGRPLTQTKTKNGNTTETTTYKYNDDAEVPYVTVETKKADRSKVMTNVLEVDENGNFAGEDFIDRQTTTMDGTTTHIFTVNNCVVEQQVKPNGKKIDTIYKGDSIEDYDNKKLNRVYQKTEQNGEVHEVEYDGNGNTRTVVQNGESPTAIAKKFGVKESSLRKLNPAKGKNSITQVGADIVVPGEYDADARVMTRRKTKLGAMQDFASDEVQRTAERLYSSTMQEVTLDKDYKDAYAYARALLAADGVKNPSNQQVNNKANEILVANGNIKFKKGTKIQIAAKTADSKFVQDLSNNGFKPTRENAIFYNRFNALNPTQQQNVLSVIKYCKSQNITDPNQIKARILETFPDINLFDSGKTIPQSDLMTPAYQRKNPVALETFLTETLKLDLKSDVGRQVYERLASLPQEELGRINGSNFGDMSKAYFDEIANSFETSGVNIRTQMEYEMELNRRNLQAERLGIPQQKFTSEMLANIYDRAADMMEQYYHNHGVFDAGTYLEGMKNLMDWITPDNLFGIDMRSTLHVASDCRKAAQRFRQMHTDSPETFKREYAQLKKDGLVTADYNQQNVQEFMNLIQSGEVDINSDKFKNACQKAFGFKGVENTEKYIQTGEMAGNIGDIAVMLYTLGAASELKMMGKATTGVYGALEKGAGRIMSKTAAQKTAKVGTSMLMGGTTLGGFTLGKETLNNLSNPMRDATSWETWKQTGIASAESFGFGAFGGLLNETVVAPIVKAIEKPATKATQAVSKALTEQGELTGRQIMETVSESGSLKLDGLFKMNSQEWANLARTATAKGVGFGVEVTGFTAYEAGLDIIKDLIDPNTGRLPDNIDVKYLCDKFGEQLKNLGTIKGVSTFLMMRKGGKVAQKAMMNEFLSESEALKNIKFKKAEINGHEVYEVTYPNGNRAVVSSPEQAIATCQMAMQMEFLAKSLTDSEPKSEITRPQGMNAEEDALIQKARKENPATVVEEKVRRQWQQHDIETPAPDEKVDLFNLDPNAGLKEPVQNVENEVTSLIFKGKLNETLTQRYDEMGRVFTEIAQKRAADIETLAKQNPKDKQAVADGIVKILAQELGMEGFEPPIVFADTSVKLEDGTTAKTDGGADWPNGRIVINEDITNVKKLTSIISHEFVHMLQFRDVLAQYGEQGLRDLIANDKSILEDKKESYIKDALENDYNKHLLQSYNFQRVQEGTVEDYLRRIYKDEFTNTVGTEDMPRYVDQASERGAYSSQEKVDRGLDESNLGELSVGEYVPNDASLAALRAKMKAKLQAGQDVSSNNPLNRTSESTEDFELNPDGTVTRKGVPAGVNERTEQVKLIGLEDAKAKLQEFTSEENDNYIGMIIQRCSMNNQVSEVLLNEAISLLKSGVDSYDVSNIVYGFKVNDEAIDYNRIKKFHDLIDKGTNAEDASHLLSYSTDKNGLYSEDLYNKIMSLNVQDYDASRVLDACKIDGEVVESTWQKALELNSLGFKNGDIEDVLKSCRIKESQARTAKTIGFNDESYSKAKLLFEEHKFDPENISRIIERCTVDGKFSQECFDRAVSLHDKISESNIYNFVRYPNELLDFMLEIKDKYNIKEYKLDYILRECVNTIDGKTVASPICMSKAEELITKYNIEADDIGHLLYASKVDGELDLKLYEEVIKMHQAGFNRIGSIIESLTTKGQNEGETSQVNYDLLQKTKEWKELGIEDDWISQYNRQFNELKIDVNKHDLVREYHNAEFKPNEIRDLLAANGNLENLSLTEFKDKVFELKKLGLDNNKIINLLNGIGMPNGWGTPKFKLSKQNLDMVIDMIQRGVKEPDRIVRASYENYELNQDLLNTAYERIKDGISEDRLSCLNSMRRYFTEMPELEDVLINLSKTVRKDYDYNSFYSLANKVYNEMYNNKSGKDVANTVIEALKNGAKEEDVIYVLETNYGNHIGINHNKLDKSEVISQIKTKLLNALVEHPENTEQIKGITNSVARAIVDGDLSELDFCLKYPDRYRDILSTEHPLDWNGNRRPELSSRARNLMLQFDAAGVPLDDVLKYTDILCENTSYLDEPIPESTLNKIIELKNNQKLDDSTLKMIRHLPFAEKTPELIDYVMDLKEKNLLPEFNEQNEYDIPVLVRILPNNSETGKLGLYENYKDILDFYVKNKDVLRYERVNGENHYITEFDDIVRNYKDHHSGIDKALDLEPFEAMAEIVRKTSVSPETINGIIGNGYADKLKTFTDKVDLEKYSNELNLIFNQLNRYNNHSSYSDILNENISKRDLEYLLDMQKLMCENAKGNENPQILDNRWFRKFIGEKEIPAEALDKLRYYVEMEIADPNRQGRYINIDRYHHTVRLYENSPENIERIESIMYNKGFEDGMYEHILSDLSSTPEVLNRQLDLIENILDYTGELSGHKSYLQSDLISILRDAKTLEDVNVKIELWEQLKSQLQSKSSIQKFWDANVKKQNNLGMALMCVEGTNATNKSAVLAAMANKKYSDLIWNCAGNIDKNNVALIEDIIKNDRLKNPDHANFAGIVVNTSRDEFKAKFVQENFDKIPQEDLQKATSILSEINGDLIIRLYNDKELNFPKEHILDIAPYCNQMNIDLVTRLCTDKNLKFPADQIKDIARALNLTNLELAEKLCTDKSLKCPPDKIVDILSAFQLINVDTKSLSLSQKINTLGTISSMDKTLLNLCRQYSPIDIDAKIAELTVSLGKKKDIINVSAAQQQMFVQNMMANNNQNTETVLKNFDFEQYGKQGLPLKYTREQFTANIENLIKDLSPEEQEVVLEHFGLIKGSAGFDGLPTNKPFNNEKVSSQVNEIAQKVQDEIETFTARNQINTGDATADNVLNGLIKGLPEFTSIVGKEQHGTHAYSVDIHTLKVLQSAMNNPLYEKLSDRDKTILKIAALCHDLGKRGGVVDTGHASSSAEYVTAILDKFPFPQGMKDRIIDIVDNHHWFEAYNTGSATAEDVAVRCRRPEDFMIYEILAKADFENVNKDFHISRSEGVTNQAEFDKFMQDKMEAIDEALTRMYSRANLVFDTQFMQNGEKFPRQTVEVDGEPTELKVLNLSDLKGNDSLQQYGFSTGVTKESARFTVHMTDPVIASMESVMILTQNSLNQSAWSTSLIKASNNRTYCNRKFGFVLDVDQANISEANYANTGSGCGKGLETFKRILFNANGSARTYVKDHLIKELSKKGVELNDNEYAQLSRFLVVKKYTTQITKNIKIGDKVIKAADLVKCLEKSRDALFEGGDIHSEIVPINPRVKGLIAKVEKLEDCPEEFLKFAKLHNLPIILMKPTKE